MIVTAGITLALFAIDAVAGERIKVDRTGGLDLTWQAPAAECPSRALVVTEYEHLVARERPTHLSSIEARAAVTRDAQGVWTLRLATTEPVESERTLSAPTCSALGHAAAVLLALVAAPGVVPAPALAAAEPVPAGPEKATTTNTIAARPPIVAASPPQAKPRGSVAAGGGAASASVSFDSGAVAGQDVLPGLSAGAVGALELRGPRLGLRVAGTWWLPREPHASVGGGVAAQLSAWAVAVAVCASEPGRHGFVVALCLGPEVVRPGGRGLGIDTPRTDGTWIPRISALGTIELRLGSRVSPFVGLHGSRGLKTVNFVIENVGSLHRTSPWAAGLIAGLRVTLK